MVLCVFVVVFVFVVIDVVGVCVCWFGCAWC